MNRIKRKLNSQRGASITYALLIFLVCAVVGSAVLVAGTTASGRISEVAKSDQRYYAVTSAARLLINKIDNQAVTIKMINETVIDTTTSPSTSTTNTTFLDDAGNVLTDSTTFSSIPLQIAYQLMSGASAPGNTLNLTIAPTHAELNVDIAETVAANGEITITILKTTGTSPNTRTYSMKLLFNLDKSELPPVSTTSTTSSTKTTTTTTTNQYTWHLRDIQVVGAQRW